MSEQNSAFKAAKDVMWLSKVSSFGRPARANKTRLLVLPSPAFIIAILAVIIFTSLGTRRFRRAVVSGRPVRLSRILRAGSGAYPAIFGGNGMSQSDIDSLLKEDRLFTPAPGFSAGAHIKSREDYDRIYKRSVEDPEGFWSEIAGELHWFEKWNKAQEWNGTFAKG